MIVDERIQFLEEKAKDIRISIINMLVSAGSGHTAGPLGMSDVFTALYFEILKHNPGDPFWNDRDRVVLSNGHICPVLYATMAHAGYFDIEELNTLRKFGSRLQGHPHREWLPGIETSSGPLGSGLSQAIGMALADKIDNGRSSHKNFYCFLGDGELNEGQVWEALLHAGKERLHTLTAIVDRNNIQIDGFTEDIMPLESLSEKFNAFNWHVIEVDGHNMQDIVSAFRASQSIFEKPVVIIAHTIPGKGVEDFEWDFAWHGMPPNKSQGVDAINEIRTFKGKIVTE